MKILNIAISLIFLLVVLPAKSADFTLHPKKPGTILLTGIIESGDANKYLTLQKNGARSSPTDPYVSNGPFGALELDSPGGSVDEAIKIAKIVSALYVNVAVLPNKVCGSSCFLIFLAGSSRSASGSELMDPIKQKQIYLTLKNEANKAGLKNLRIPELPGFVGLHRPSIPNMTSLENNQDKVMREMSAYLDKQLLPKRLIDIMMSRPSNDVYWMTTEDLAELGHYPVNQEEFYIQKCGYIKNVEARIANSTSRTEQARLYKSMTDSVPCMVDLASTQRDLNFKKIKGGWNLY